MGTLNLGSGAIFSGNSGGLSNSPSGTIIKNGSYVTGTGTGAQTAISTQSWTNLNINGGTGQISHNITKPSANVLAFNKVSNNSHLEITCYFPVYITYSSTFIGIALLSSHDGGTNYYVTSGLSQGPYHGWGAGGGGFGGTSGNNVSNIVSYTWNTSDNISQSSTWLTKTGECRFYFQARNWQQPSNFVSYWIDYTDPSDNANYPRVGKVIIREVIQ